MTLAFIFIGLFLISFIFLLVLLVSNNKLKKKNKVLTDAVEKEIIKIKHRTGFYDGFYNMVEKENSTSSSKYTFRVYVTELEKYNNGYSKISLDNINMIYGYHKTAYEYIINNAKKIFYKLD